MLGLQLDSIATQAITSAYGNHLPCQFLCRDFNWKLHTTDFKSDMMLIPLDSWDMVLEVQWLNDLGTVKLDFKKLVMEFDFGNFHCVLKGIPPKGVKVSSRIDSQKLIANSTQLYFMQLIMLDEDEDNLKIVNCASEVGAVSYGVQEILRNYKQIFYEATKLPPTRGVFDHWILLKFGANHVSIRP